MKIAALYDIHGNLPALNAVAEELKVVRPDMIVIGGDIVSGPMPIQTLELLFQLDIKTHFIRGNNDREEVLAYDGKLTSKMSEKGREKIEWVAKQLARPQRDFLDQLPEHFIQYIEGHGEVLFCHATPKSDEEIFTPNTSQERLDSIFSDVQQQTVVCGHTHIQFERLVGNIRIINAGSVGMPFADRPGAYWLLITSDGYEFRCTEYNFQEAANEIKSSGDPQATEFAERNVLSVPSVAQATEMLEHMSKNK